MLASEIKGGDGDEVFREILSRVKGVYKSACAEAYGIYELSIAEFDDESVVVVTVSANKEARVKEPRAILSQFEEVFAFETSVADIQVYEHKVLRYWGRTDHDHDVLMNMPEEIILEMLFGEIYQVNGMKDIFRSPRRENPEYLLSPCPF